MTDPMTPATPSTPAGWYPDPAGSAQRRWWDGARWTEQLETPYSATAAAAPERAPEGTDPYTTWIWLILAIPVLQLFTFFLIDWEQLILATFTATGDSAQQGLLTSPGYLASTAIGWVGNALIVLFAYVDWRELKQRGVPQPFHWAWSFLVLAVGSIVYVIGRSVVARRRTGRGIAPMWIAIGTVVLSIVVAIGLSIYLVQLAFTTVDFVNLTP